MLLWLLASLFIKTSSAAISCFGDDGQPVDWFIVYKLPKLPDQESSAGMKYMYQDGASGGWVPGKSIINDTESAVGKTVNQLYGRENTEDVAYVLYNDQPPPPETSNFIRGHTKGFVLLDKTQGFWLVHSTPHFPPPADQKYGWPTSGLHNGQSFLCVTYPYNQFKDVGTQLMYNTITPYSTNIPDVFSSDLPNLKAAAEEKPVDTPPWNSQVALTSVGGKTFTSFSKNANFGDDLYSGWIAPTLKSDLYVQFWLNSRGILPSNCSQTCHTFNIMSIGFNQSLNFSSHLDHSKWCVTGSATPGWTCIGDMNRNLGEMHRGGGTVCLKDTTIWKSFSALVSDYSKCA
uniref:Deoxyribonuclease-2-alpha n=1 Tax=Leptobrachium leishanense TaxID=445787 RepID=A0A8C5Q767_9ANUR